MSDPKCKICRRAGEKLFLKGAKCFSPKCTFEKNPNPPGKPLSERKHRTSITEFGTQLREKQKIRNVYGISESQFARYVKESIGTKKGTPVESLYQALEMRLDNAVFRLGYAESRAHARQLVAHGHFLVGRHRVTIPSYRLSSGDELRVREGSRKSPVFVDSAGKLKDKAVPNWIVSDLKAFSATVKGVPKFDKGEAGFNIASVIEFYSR